MAFRRTLSSYFSILTLAGSLSACSALTVNAGEPVSIPLKSVTGDTANISYILEKPIFDGVSEGILRSKVQSTLKVISTDGGQTIMSWTMNAAEDEFVGIDKSPGSDNPAIKEYEAIFEALFMGTPLPFIADKNGAPLQFFEKEHLLDDLADRAFTLGSKDKDIKMNLSFFLDMSEGSPKLMLLSIPALMSMCQDTELTIGNPTKYQEKSSVTGAGTLDANVSFELISIDRSAQLANLIFSSRLDVESQKDILRERSKSSDTPFTETEIENFLVRGEEQAECLVDMKTGWVKSMTHSYVVNAKNKTNRMTHSIEVNWR